MSGFEIVSRDVREAIVDGWWGGWELCSELGGFGTTVVMGMLLIGMMSFSVFALDEPKPTKINLQDATFKWKTTQSLVAKLVDDDNVPLGGKEIWFYVDTPAGWNGLGPMITNESGFAEYDFMVTMPNGEYLFKAVFNDDQNYIHCSDTAKITVVDNAVITLSFVAVCVVKWVAVEAVAWGAKKIASEPAADVCKAHGWEVCDTKEEMDRNIDVGTTIAVIGHSAYKGLGHGVKAIKEYHRVVPESLAGRYPHFLHHSYETIKESADITVNVILNEIKKDVVMTPEQEDELLNTFSTSYESFVPAPIYEWKSYPEQWEGCEVDPLVGHTTTMDVPENTAKLVINLGWELPICPISPDFFLLKDPSGNPVTPSFRYLTITEEDITVAELVVDDPDPGEWMLWLDGSVIGDWEMGIVVSFDKYMAVLPKHLTATSGKTAIYKVIINNFEDTSTTVDLSYSNIPAGWDAELSEASVVLSPQTSSAVDFSITPPTTAPPSISETVTVTVEFQEEGVSYSDNCIVHISPGIEVMSPTTGAPAIVGDPNYPAEFMVKVSTGMPYISCTEIPYVSFDDIFSAKVGDKPAEITILPSFSDNKEGIYTLLVSPPSQGMEGLYDLSINLALGEIIADYDVEPDAVIYSTGGNIDVVEVIDRSGSMQGEPIQVAKDSAKLFVDLMNTNDMIGVASYSSGASVNYGLTEITSDTTKQNAKNAIDGISAGGMTSIGAGLRAAYNELVNKGDPSHPHSIVLMSDGWHNTAPHPDTVLPDIRNANIRVFTIGLGAGADASLLSHIAHDSGCGGGEYYYSPGSGELSAIYNAIAGVVKAESTVKTVTGSVQQGETITHKIDIDPAIDVVTFTVTWTSGTLNLELERPDGSKVDPSDPDVISHTKEATYETYTMDSPMVGEWTMEITAPSTSSSAKTATSDVTNAGDGVTANKADSSMINDDWSTEIDVSAIVKSAQKAVTAQAGISYTATVTATTNLTVHTYTDKDQYSLNEPMGIIAALTKAGSPVTGADVNVTIERPDGAKDYLSLYDDGKHDDGVALDGVYANYYTNAGVSGSYTITVHASGTMSPEEFTREVKKSVYVSGVSAGEISVTPTSWDAGIVHPGGDIISAFTVSSTSTKDETVMISATDLTDGHGNVIGSENVIGMPSTFVVPAGGSDVFWADEKMLIRPH